METLQNVPSTDNYSDANTLIQQGSGTLELLVANAAITISLYLPSGGGVGYEWGPPLFVGPSISARTYPDVGGVKFKSALAGSAAQVSAVLYTQDEALSVSTSAFTSTISPSGAVSPPPPTTGTLNFDHNGAAVGTESTLDVVDAAAVGNPTNPPITWLAVDTPGSKVAYTPVFKHGVQHNGAGQVNEPVLDFEDQATFPALTWALTDDAANNRVKVTPTITGVLALLADSGVLGAPAGTIDFTGIPATFFCLKIIYYGATSAALIVGQLAIRFNNDSGANYLDENDTINAGLVANQENSAAATSGSIGTIEGASATNPVSAGEIIIPGYAGTTLRKVAAGFSYSGASALVANQVTGHSGCYWNNTAAINRVTLFPRSGNWIAGSRVVLYGL